MRETGFNAGPTGKLVGAVTVDQTSPSVSITHGNANVTTGAITYNFVFTEPVSGFVASDVVLTNGTAGTVSSTDASHYSLVVNPTVTGTPNALAINVGINAATDIAGNPNAAGSADRKSVV